MAVRLKVVGTADLKEFDKAQRKLDALRKEAVKAQPGISGAMARAGDSMQKFGDKTRGVGVTLSKNFTAPLAIAGAALYKFTQNAAEDAKAQSTLAKALQNTTGATTDQIAAVEDWITAQGKALGVADDALRPALATLAGSFGDIKDAQKAATLAMDIAAARGVSVEQAAKALAKANAGQTRGLAMLVPGIDNATLATKDYGKISAAAAKIVGGQAANAADTAAGAMERNKVAMDEAMESIGYAFIPIMEDFNRILQNNVVPAIQKVADWFGQLSPKTRKVIVVIGLVVAVLGPLLVIIGSVISALGVVAGAFAAISLPVLAVVAAVVAVIAILVLLYKKNETFRNFVLDAWKKIKVGVQVFVEWFKSSAWPFIKLVFDNFVISMKIIWTVVKVVFTAISAYIKFVFNSIKTAFALFSAVLTGDWSKAWNIIKDVFKNIWSKLPPIAKGALDKVVNFVKGLGGRVKTAIGDAKDWLLDAGKDLILGLWNGVKDKWDWLKDKITGLGKSVTGWAKEALGIKSPSTVFAGIGRNIGEGLRNGIEASVPMVRNAAVGLANSATMSTSVNLAGVGSAPLALGGGSSNTVTVAPGAVQITFMGNASASDTQQVVDAAFARLVRELRAK